MIGSRRLHRGIDHPDLAVRIRPQELRHSSTDAVVTGDPAADENPASLPLGEGEGLNARGAGELAAGVLRRIHGKREMSCREQREYGKSVHCNISAANAAQTVSKERLAAFSQARAANPVMFATAKLMPQRFLPVGTPGNGRGKPEAKKRGEPLTCAIR